MSDPLDDFFDTGNDITPITLDPTMQALLDQWRATIQNGGIGFLPRNTRQRTYWYAFAPSTRQRRELLGLLDAWIGPTYSDLPRARGELEPTDPFDAALTSLKVPPLRFEVLPRVPPHSGPAKKAVRNALTTLTRLANERPPSHFDAARTTVEILDDLGHAIAAGDRALAETCMVELELSADLDESNLAFLRLRLYAGMRDWAAVLADPALDHVLSMRRPLGVTRVIQAGLYHERFEHLDHQGAESALRTAAEHLPQALRDLYTGAPPSNCAEAVVELVCRLLATRSATNPAVKELIAAASTIESGLDGHFRRIVDAFVPAETVVEPGPETPTGQLGSGPELQILSLMSQGEFAACIELGVTSKPSVEAGRVIVHAARQLSSAKWAAMVVDYLVTHDLKEQVAATAPMLRKDVEWLESLCGQSPLRGWEDWFVSLNDPKAGPLQLSHEAIQSWEPLSNTQFVDLLTHASETTLAQLGESGGRFLAAHSDLFYSPDAAEVTLQVLAAMALSGKASAGIRVQTLALCESLSASAPSRSTFEDILEWTEMILDVNIAATTVSWACDIVQTLTAIPASRSTERVLAFYFKALEALRPFRPALTTAELEALELVAAELNTQVPADFRAIQATTVNEDGAAAYRYLDGKTLVLHSLTVTAITRAAQVLKRLVPTIDVRTNSEYDGSPQLAHASANADLFVVVTAAAKHAATTFIDTHRGSLPTILVNSRGSSAILRELAAFEGLA